MAFTCAPHVPMRATCPHHVGRHAHQGEVAHGFVPKALFHRRSFRSTTIKSSLHSGPHPVHVTREDLEATTRRTQVRVDGLARQVVAGGECRFIEQRMRGFCAVAGFLIFLLARFAMLPILAGRATPAALVALHGRGMALRNLIE